MLRRRRGSVRSFYAALVAGSLGLGCSKPNPGWFDDESASDGTSDGTSTSTNASAGESTSTSTSAGEPTSTSTSTSTSAADTGTETSTTGEPLPSCGPLAGAVVQWDAPKEFCQLGVQFGLKITGGQGQAQAELCSSGCGLCFGVMIAVGEELLDLIPEGSCLSVVHDGVWAPEDPETLSGCKTTGVQIYLNEDKEPLYVASSRVFAPPKGLDPAFALEVTAAEEVACSCDLDVCCEDAPAGRYKLQFAKDGAVKTLEPGSMALGDFSLSGLTYWVEALRGHRRGYATKGAMSCESPIDLVDWQMFRLP